MSGRARSREPESQTMSNETILRECHSLYTDPDKGLIKIGQELGLNVTPPRRKVVVLLIGNHSAGKSSFINWYIEEDLLKTGVAIESQGFTIVSSGKKRESLLGKAALKLYPQFNCLKSVTGLTNCLSTEICPSTQKQFKLVTFIDTPGLDGGIHYSFDIYDAMLSFAHVVDLIFVLFDPIGQALCERTLKLVDALMVEYPNKVKFYLSKADDAGSDSDRQKVMLQIVQELCKFPAVSNNRFDIQTIYIPNLSQDRRCVNQIDEAAAEIEKMVSATVQNTLNALDHDSDVIEQLLTSRLQSDALDRSHNTRRFTSALTYIIMTFLMLLFVGFNSLLIYSNGALVESLVGHDVFVVISKYLEPVQKIFLQLHSNDPYLLPSFLFLSIGTLLYLTRRSTSFKTTYSKRESNRYKDIKSYFDNVLNPKRKLLYRQYLEQSASDHDL